MSKRALQSFLRLPEDALSSRPRSRSLHGDRGNIAAGSDHTQPVYANLGPTDGLMASSDQDGEATMPLAM